MNLMDSIREFEEDSSKECSKCENYRQGYEGPYCVFYEEEPLGPCSNWVLSAFWKNKRGY